MASLDRMAIRGVRSFDDKQINVIQFLTPLTVIVGTNGSGKTTIIECLKYCTTGDMPPNSKGGAFVHDPGMASANEVKAQVRLRFYNTNRVRINCARNLQVTRKKGGGLTMKTLEAILQVDDQHKDNRRTVLSTKCAEVDEEMPSMLGVSRAILDNVIFCHQEDNNWPLGEPSSLKKRFDDIFEATRYTKALDNIKNLRKERAVSLKVAKAELDGLKVDRQRADAVKKKMDRLEAELKEKEDRLEQLNAEVEDLTNSNKEMYDKAVRFRETVQRAESLEDKKQLHEESLASLRETITELHEDEAELQRRKDGFENHLHELKRKQDEKRRTIATKRDDIREAERLHSKRLSEKGALESDKKNHEQAYQRRIGTIKNISLDLGIKGFEEVDSLTEERINDFTSLVDDQLRQLRREYQQMKTEDARKEDDLNSRLQDLRSVKGAKEASCAALSDDIVRQKDRIKKAQSAIDDMPSGNVDVEAAKKEHAAQVARMRELNQEQADARHDDMIRDKNAETRQLDDRREELTSELNSLNRQADFRAKLDMCKKSATQKKSEIDAIVLRNADALTRLTGGSSSPETMEAEVEKAKGQKEKDLAKLEEDHADANKEYQQSQSTLSFAKAQLETKTAQATEIDREIFDSLEREDETLDKGIRQCNEEIQFLKPHIALYESMSSFVKNLEEQVKDKKVCLGCNRGIGHDELPAVQAHIQDMLQKTQLVEMQSLKNDLASWEELLDKYMILKPKQARSIVLREEEMPKHAAEVADAEKRVQEANQRASKTGSDVEACRTLLKELTSLSNAAANVSRLITEQMQLEKDTTTLESDLRSTGSARTGDEVQTEIDGLTDRIKRLKREAQTLQQEKDTLRATITNQERNVHKAELAVADKTREQEQVLAQQKRLEEFKSELEEALRKSQSLEKDIAASSEPLQRLGERLAKFKREATDKQSVAQAKIAQISEFARELQESTSAAERFVNLRGPQKLKECERAIEELQAQMHATREDIRRVQQEVDSIEKDLNESRATERNISDNLRCVRLQRDIKAIDEELRDMDLEEASRANRVWNDKYNASKRIENDLNGKAAHLNGEISGLHAQIESRQSELRDDYKDVHATYTRKLIEHKTSELAQNDLELYQKALNAAIMRFHSIKMEEINETLNDLWVKTYKGTDIDTIMIRADGEGVGNRTYNYRVVMVKDSIEMDMRGRCSAGQKCLASILIRLSLADSFSENCGIMALDEPTTNLDEHNILALAESLGTLIEERRRQSNFQLIIITHDVNFLSQLAHSSGGIERYFRVERDQNYRSTIVQETQLP